jgi:hypothetical protein
VGLGVPDLMLLTQAQHEDEILVSSQSSTEKEVGHLDATFDFDGLNTLSMRKREAKQE